MKITDIKTFLVDATPPGGWGGGGRNWLFVKVETDEGIVGWGEASGWPRVIETAVQDLKTVLVGLDPSQLDRRALEVRNGLDKVVSDPCQPCLRPLCNLVSGLAKGPCQPCLRPCARGPRLAGLLPRSSRL